MLDEIAFAATSPRTPGLAPLLDVTPGSLGRRSTDDLLATVLGGAGATSQVRRHAAELAALPLRQLRSLGVDQLVHDHRLRRDQALRLVALLEVVERWSLDDRPTITSARDALLILDDLCDADSERLDALLLDARNRVLGRVTVAVGGLNVTRLTPRDVLRPALMANAASVLVAHPHPSGDPNPSRSDRTVTAALREAANALGVRLIDHLVVARHGHYSFAEAGGWNADADATVLAAPQ